MKKILLLLCLVILLVSMVAINAESVDSDNSTNKSDIQKQIKKDIKELKRDTQELKENDSDNKTNLRREVKKDINDFKEDIKELKEDIKEKRRDIKELITEHRGEYITNLKGKNMTIREVSEDKREMIIDKINTRTGLNLTVEDLDNETSLGAWLSNGRHALVKVMPNTASKKAIERLKLKVCNESNNCTIELKEVGIGNKTKLAYEIKAEEESKVLFLFKNRMKVIAEVDGETGEIISARRPWWSFLAKKQD